MGGSRPLTAPTPPRPLTAASGKRFKAPTLQVIFLTPNNQTLNL